MSSSARRRRVRRGLAPSTASTLNLVLGSDKPRAECPYQEIYPDLDVRIPLKVQFTKADFRPSRDGDDSVHERDHSNDHFTGNENDINGERNVRGRAIVKRKRRTNDEVWGTRDKPVVLISGRTRRGALVDDTSDVGTNGSVSGNDLNGHAQDGEMSSHDGADTSDINGGEDDVEENEENDDGNRESNHDNEYDEEETNDASLKETSKSTEQAPDSGARPARVTRSSVNNTSSNLSQSPLRRSSRRSHVSNYYAPVLLHLTGGSNGGNNESPERATSAPVLNSTSDQTDSSKSTNQSDKNSNFRVLPNNDKKTTPDINDKLLISVGYKESNVFILPDSYIRTFVALDQSTINESEESYNSSDSNTTVRTGKKESTSYFNPVEYDMDEQDEHFLNLLNSRRENHIIKRRPLPPISRELFEITMTLLEIEWMEIEKRMPAKKKTMAGKDSLLPSDATETEEKCVICDDSECDNSNAIVFCDGCDIAVHQDCYGVPFIPEGQWLCRQCTVSRRLRASCIFCPNRSGGFKQTDSQHWAHVLCALWIPETSVANISYMEPIIGVDNIPKGRLKLNCYICKQKVGACIQCVNKNCFQAFHPTCARRAKLYMKMEAGILGAVHDVGSMITYCDRHGPPAYNETVDVRHHLKEAQRYYSELREKQNTFASGTVKKATTSTPAATSSKEPKWRTEEGTPIIPKLIVNKVASRMMKKFELVEFVDHFLLEVCRYWALKRMKKGASLIKRLQIALEVQPKRSSEGMSPVDVRVDIATKRQLLKKMEVLVMEANKILERETLKSERTETQHEAMDLVYFPHINLIRRIWTDVLRKFAIPLSVSKNSPLYEKLLNRQYTSVDEFSIDLDSFLAALTPPVTKPKWLQTRLRQAKAAADALTNHETDVSAIFEVEASGLDIQREEWAGARVFREMSPMSDIDDSELQSLETESLEFTLDASSPTAHRRPPKKRRR
ncbi:Nto1p [Sugiyamaella lignohabitans]|uniref:Nto1p n=1 Tax=Sugiyamaella lignohabitans TaxID=796027 RepID=A0A167D044_9ASCO|nr:Nto1p [Sugiyamaella lignohabitans]ANB12313.1 Nto1p [Sugiyamaella lignohabitans]